MPLTPERKREVIDHFRIHDSDSGSAEVQIALLTERIKALSGHLKSHKKDYSTQLGLLKLVGQRRRLLAYLKKSDLNAYGNVIKQLDLRK